MIITALLKLILFILEILSNIFGGLIPSFPDVIMNLLNTAVSMIQSGISFISYFFLWEVIIIIFSIIIAWYSFVVIKNVIMKVIGHFFAN